MIFMNNCIVTSHTWYTLVELAFYYYKNYKVLKRTFQELIGIVKELRHKQ